MSKPVYAITSNFTRYSTVDLSAILAILYSKYAIHCTRVSSISGFKVDYLSKIQHTMVSGDATELYVNIDYRSSAERNSVVRVVKPKELPIDSLTMLAHSQSGQVVPPIVQQQIISRLVSMMLATYGARGYLAWIKAGYPTSKESGRVFSLPHEPAKLVEAIQEAMKIPIRVERASAEKKPIVPPEVKTERELKILKDRRAKQQYVIEKLLSDLPKFRNDSINIAKREDYLISKGLPLIRSGYSDADLGTVELEKHLTKALEKLKEAMK